MKHTHTREEANPVATAPGTVPGRYFATVILALFWLTTIGGASPQAQVEQPQKNQMPKEKPKPSFSAEEIKEARELLGSLGYWVNFEVTGLDASMRHALIAFQKIEGRERTGIFTQAELEAIRVAHKPVPLENGYNHIEVNLPLQVLFVVDCCGAILRILPVSSGSGDFFTEGGRTRQAITPIGRFAMQRKIAGWRKSPLGLLYYPNYFHGGIAIHGNPAVPAFPASHGCIRIPMFASKEFSVMAKVGMIVLVHDGNPLPPPETLADSEKRKPGEIK